MEYTLDISLGSYIYPRVIEKKYGPGFLHKKSWFAYREREVKGLSELFLVHKFSTGRRVVLYVADLLNLTYSLHDYKNPFDAKKVDRKTYYVGRSENVHCWLDKSSAKVSLCNSEVPLEIAKAKRLIKLASVADRNIPNDNSNLKFGVYKEKLCIAKQLDVKTNEWLVVQKDVKRVVISDEDNFRLLEVPETICFSPGNFIHFDGTRCWYDSEHYVFEDKAQEIARYYGIKNLQPTFSPVVVEHYLYCWLMKYKGEYVWVMDINTGQIKKLCNWYPGNVRIQPAKTLDLWMFYSGYVEVPE